MCLLISVLFFVCFVPFQYSSIDTSPLSVNVMHPFWNSLVKVNIHTVIQYDSFQWIVFTICLFLFNDIYQCFNCLFQFFPKWVAPNLVTFVGFLFTALTFIILSWYDWNYYASTGFEGTTPVPNWFWLCAAINIFLAYTLDGVDGKLARRIGLSGPLGKFK